ncbi:type IV-A pilus assembly ATPase PilB [Thiotrichales bacterium 19S3-7]|nr:type IV-A pilus assembly ATPase PilB [Thiotrichales bacterium 19S3-7]MCF6802944.1 type IV-A pilus assembly ATPase PilB [Thiotrichales bacterium 19S3-11]
MTPVDQLQGISSFLIKECAVDPQAITNAKLAIASSKESFLSYLSQHHLIDEVDFAHRAAKFYALPLIDIKLVDPSVIPDKYLDDNLIKRYQVVPIFKRNNSLILATSQPLNVEAMQSYRFFSGMDVLCVLCIASELEAFINKITQFYAHQVLADYTDESLSEIEFDIALSSHTKTETQTDAPIVKFVNKTIVDAIKKGASDIHFEPFERQYRIRYRLDGILYEQSKPPVHLAKQLTSRLKIMANLDIAERRLPQDGRFKMQISKRSSVDFRVSTCPTLYGEKIVLRILDSGQLNLSVHELGLEAHQKAQYLNALDLSQGMVLVTGPTGSGKTVTLYSGLSLINKLDKNLSTAEDPIEINLPGVNQVNINPKTGLSFASTLRAFLRQDPDIIMIGEIRDLETAEIAIKAAQTGHLVLSTLHTNNACETITRLASMGIAAYNIASSITLVIAQRLIRKLCDYCKEEDHVHLTALKELGFQETQLDEDVTVYKACGCDRCNHGYKGRIGVFEVLEITPEIQRLILEKANVAELSKEAKSQKFITLKDAIILKILQGVTSLEELTRVT